jgi:predicted NAD/FAD-binding protein
MNKEIYYDIVCIGAGPSGLALAQMCCKLNKKILIIDQEDDIGGCHRVRRQYVPELGENMFTEHGPRVYSETYITFRKLLKEMGVDFYDLFQKYNFNITEIGGETVFSKLSFSEILSFVLPFLYLIFNDNYGIDISLFI